MVALSPDAKTVEVLPDYHLLVSFDNGEIKIFDVNPLLSRKCYQPLKNIEFFSLASIENGCITWPNNLDIDPEWLYEDSVAYK